MRPVKPLTMSVPNRCALSMIVSQAASVSRSLSPPSSGLPNTPIELTIDVGVADRLADLAGQPRDVLAAERLPEERLDALEAERQDLP